MESYIKQKNILILGAHSDDEVLGLGGMILIAKKLGSKVTVLIVTDSVSEQYKNDKKKKLIEREQALKESCKVLGVDKFSNLNFPDMRLDTVPHVEINNSLSNFVNENSFDTVFVHHPNDLNLDHRLLFESALVVGRPFPNQQIKNIITYYTPSSTEWNAFDSGRIFVPNLYLNIEDVFEKKIEAVLKYKDEIKEYPHPRSTESIKIMANYFGTQVGLKLAEPFRLIRSISI